MGCVSDTPVQTTELPHDRQPEEGCPSRLTRTSPSRSPGPAVVRCARDGVEVTAGGGHREPAETRFKTRAKCRDRGWLSHKKPDFSRAPPDGSGQECEDQSCTPVVSICPGRDQSCTPAVSICPGREQPCPDPDSIEPCRGNGARGADSITTVGRQPCVRGGTMAQSRKTYVLGLGRLRTDRPHRCSGRVACWPRSDLTASGRDRPRPDPGHE
jgi:hypothetical protein